MNKLILCAVLALSSPAALAQAATFPSKPIRIVVPFNAGSGADTSSRIYGEMLSKKLGQPVIVENKPGGSGLLAIQAVKAAPADGHTIMQASNSPMAVNPIVIKDLPYDPFKEFKPVAGNTVGPAALVASPQSPYKTINELVAAAKKEKRPLMVGNYSAGYQLIATWLGTAAGVEVVHVPYKGGAQMVADVIGGQLDVGAMDFGGTPALVKEGRIRVLAITGDKRHAQYPDIPTMIESGFDGFETYVWSSFFVLSATPDDITEKLASAVIEVMNSDEAKAYQATITGTPLMLKTDEMRRFQVREYERFKRVAEAAGVQPK